MHILSFMLAQIGLGVKMMFPIRNTVYSFFGRAKVVLCRVYFFLVVFKDTFPVMGL